MNELTAVVMIVIAIQDLPEKPVLDLSPSDSSTLDQSIPTFFVVGGSSVQLFSEAVAITDEDIGDSIAEVRIKFSNRPNGVQEGLLKNSNSLLSTSDIFTIPLTGTLDYSGELATLFYFNSLSSPDSQSRMVEVTAVDSTGEESEAARLLIQFLTIPSFPMSDYTLFVYENSLLPDAIVVSAFVGDGSFTGFIYGVSGPGSDHFSISDTGNVSLIMELDREGSLGHTFPITVSVSLLNSYSISSYNTCCYVILTGYRST